jgi:DNA-binding transcriptional regulator YiaG
MLNVVKKKLTPWSDRIKTLQKSLDFSNEQMADALGVSTDTLHTWKYRKDREVNKTAQRLIELLESQIEEK